MCAACKHLSQSVWIDQRKVIKKNACRCTSWKWRRRKQTPSPTRCSHPQWQGWIFWCLIPCSPVWNILNKTHLQDAFTHQWDTSQYQHTFPAMKSIHLSLISVVVIQHQNPFVYGSQTLRIARSMSIMINFNFISAIIGLKSQQV